MAIPADPCVAVVDDDVSFCRSVRRWLNAWNFVAAIYYSAEDFLADPYNERFACLLVDIQLGGMSGLEMHRRFAAQGSRTPVIFISAHEEPPAIPGAVSAGCVFLRKTVEGAQLMEAIRTACRS